MDLARPPGCRSGQGKVPRPSMCPHEVPQGAVHRSGPRGPVWALTGLRYVHPERRTPRPVHVGPPGPGDPRRGLPPEVCRYRWSETKDPQDLIVPTGDTHGFRSPVTDVKGSAAAGTCSGRSAPDKSDGKYERRECHRGMCAPRDDLDLE